MLNLILLLGLWWNSTTSLTLQPSIAGQRPAPGVLMVATGVKWSAISEFAGFGAEELLGYRVTVGGQAARLHGVSEDALTFVIPPATGLGGQMVYINGPAGGYAEILEVGDSPPVVMELGGFAVVYGNSLYFPLPYIRGDAVPVSPSSFNYVGIQVAGFSNEEPVTVILTQGSAWYEIDGTAYPMPGYPTAQRAMIFAPPCADGGFNVQVRGRSNRITALSRMVFKADCRIFADGARVRTIR